MSDRKTTPGGRAVEASVEIAAPVEAVWKALTDAEELTRWFPLEARVTPGPNGSIWISWGKDFAGEVRIEVWEPNRRLRTVEERPAPEWGRGGGEAGTPGAGGPQGSAPVRIAVDYFLEGKGGKTVLRLVHGGFGPEPEWDNEYNDVSRGWQFELRGLRHYLERHRGTPRHAFWARRPVKAPLGDAWARLLSAEGVAFEGDSSALKEGSPYALRIAGGDRLTGTTHVCSPPWGFSGTAENLGGALFRIQNMDYYGIREISLWLSAYGLPAAQVEEIRARWEELLRRLFP
jgi:uncharacterized protein YndB with AHSA1/START domain